LPQVLHAAPNFNIETIKKKFILRLAIWFFGSEQEFDKRPISCGFGESDEFGFGDCHTLSLEGQ